MFPNFIITFRETLEATLIIGIILGYLKKTKQTQYNQVVYLGSLFGVLASILGAVIFSKLTGGFSGEIEKIFEGITMLIASSLIGTMIIWMISQKNIAEKLTKKVEEKIRAAKNIEIFFLIFFAVLREGVEIILFLSAANLSLEKTHFLAGFAGLLIAILVGYLVFKSTNKLKPKIFFKISTYLLVLFAAGLFAHGIHEFQEAGVLPTIIKHIWDINTIVDENSFIGNFMRDLFGYNSNPSLLETAGYILYLGIFWKIITNPKKLN